MSTSELNFDLPIGPLTVNYLDLGGGLNTRLDPHALERNELAVSQNLWPAFDRAVAKRPGSQALVTSNGSVNTVTHATKSLLTCRFNSQTYLIHVDTTGIVSAAPANGVSAWVKIGNVNPLAAFVTAAQMFEPTTQKQQVFLCDGLSVPQMWAGPPATTLVTVPTGAGFLPDKYGTSTPGSAPITPQYVKTLGNNSHLFYSGESSNATAVYVSDPFFPTQFNYAAAQADNDPTSGYNPAIIGNNDGVEGGIITGMESLGSTMIVFKEAAIYTMVQTTLLGEIPAWQVVEVSNATGNQAPRSLIRFATFVTFVGVDGIYITDGQTVTQISDDVPTYFDASLLGTSPICTNRTGVLGVRHGYRAEFFFPAANASFANTGLWFDFSKATRFGHPLCGEIDGMNVGGIVALRGPTDDGNVAWGDAVQNRVGKFGVGSADLDPTTGAATLPIQTLLIGKADLFDDIFGPEVAIAHKQVQDAYALIQSHAATPQQVDFYGEIIVDLGLTLGRVIIQPYTAIGGAGIWGPIAPPASTWGPMSPPAGTWGSAAGQQFRRVKIPFQAGARGYLMQVGIMERSVVPWVMIGYAVRVNPQKAGY